jgi:Protein of unknown function (DUF4231)
MKGHADVTDEQGQVSFLLGELDRQERRFAHRRRRDKRKAFALQVSTVVFSATITVLLGLQVGSRTQSTFKNIALALGALVTVLAAMEAFFNHRGLWIGRTVTVRRLEDLRRHLEYRLAGLDGTQLEPKLADSFLAELDEIIAEDQRTWMRLRSEGPSATRSPDTRRP